jgi:ABC-2 type transporter
MGALYVSVLFVGIINSMQVQPVVGAVRPVFNRERAAGMYSVLPYMSAQLIVEIPYNLLQVRTGVRADRQTDRHRMRRCNCWASRL